MLLVEGETASGAKLERDMNELEHVDVGRKGYRSCRYPLPSLLKSIDHSITPDNIVILHCLCCRLWIQAGLLHCTLAVLK